MTDIGLILLKCPHCGSFPEGLRHDKVFFCLDCEVAILPSTPEAKTYPVVFAADEIRHEGTKLYLPFWRINVAIDPKNASDRQRQAFLEMTPIETIWVTAFLMLRPGYHGDLGLKLTEKQWGVKRLSTAPPGGHLAGATRNPDDALKYGQLFVTELVDRRADVTGMQIVLTLKDAELWAIPFADNRDTIMDLVTGTSFPASTVDDLEGLRTLNRQ